MEPWNYEARGYTNRELKKLDFVSNNEIQSYMNPDSSQSKLFLVGPKGCGKTLLLHKKAYEYFYGDHNKLKEEGKVKNVSNDLVEILSFAGLYLPDTILLELKDHNKWKEIWTFAIGLATLQTSGVDIPKRLYPILEEFEGFNGIKYIIPHILNNYEEFRRQRLFLNNNLIMSCISKLQDRHVLFIDGLDQALGKLLTSSDYDIAREHDPYLLYIVWQTAQFGMLLACHDLPTSHNRRLVVYATAREEALYVADQMAINISGYCINLYYTDEQLRQIFLKNVKHTSPKNLYGTPDDNLVIRMFGCEELSHIVPKSSNGELKKEHPLQLILRHTFRRPREVVLLGYKLFSRFNANLNKENRANEERKIQIRKEINRVANKHILSGYKKEIFPGFRDDYLNQFLEIVGKNVVQKEELQKIDEAVVNYLFRVGLLGYVDGNIQRFEPAVSHIHAENKKIPISDYYLVHPSLDPRFQEKYSVDEFYDKQNIVGNGCPFERPSTSVLHVGIGKEVGYFIPDDIPGRKSFEERWKQAKVFAPPNKLFQLIFMLESPDAANIRRKRRIDEASRMLTLLMFRWGAEKVESVFNQNLTAWKKELDESVALLKGNTAYETRIDNTSEKDLNIFTTRIFGRIVVIGMLLVLGFDNAEAKSVIRSFNPAGNLKSTNTTQESTYLRHAFFIAHLPEHGPLGHDQISNIWASLSQFERDFLKEWYIKTTRFSIPMHRNFSEKEQAYLEEKIKERFFSRLIETSIE